MIVFWVLWGQFNALHQNWLVGYGCGFALNNFQAQLNTVAPFNNGETWKSMAIWTTNMGDFFAKNGINQNAAMTVLNQAANSYGMSGWGVGIIANWRFFVIMVADLLISILFLQLGIFFTKWFFYDAYPMVVAVWVTMFVLNVCGLLNYNNWWSYIVVIISLVTSLLVFLFVMVQIVNALLARTKLGEYYYEALLKSNKREAKVDQGQYIKNYEKYKANKKKSITFEKD